MQIGEYIAEHESPKRARDVVEQIERLVGTLAEFPHRGRYVREMLQLGVSDFREVTYGPFRVVYEVTSDEVDVHLIADGRRDMRALLTRRLMQA